MLALIYFIILAVITLGAAACVLLSRHPLYGGLSLIVSMVSLAGISKTPMFDKVSLFIIPAVIVLAGLVGFALVRSPLAFDTTTLRGSVALTSKTLFDVAQTGPGYFVLFEILGLLLLSAMVAAVLLAKKRLGSVESENMEDKH